LIVSNACQLAQKRQKLHLYRGIGLVVLAVIFFLIGFWWNPLDIPWLLAGAFFLFSLVWLIYGGYYKTNEIKGYRFALTKYMLPTMDFALAKTFPDQNN
jgi:hypothetical protein